MRMVNLRREEAALRAMFQELTKAEAKFPGWPDDPVHGACIVAEETGEMCQAALDYYYGRAKSLRKLRKEAAQTAAMGLRMLFWVVTKEREKRNANKN